MSDTTNANNIRIHYQIEAEDYAELEEMKRAMFATSSLSGSKLADIANRLSVILARAIEVQE